MRQCKSTKQLKKTILFQLLVETDQNIWFISFP